jgi:aerobic carbon-monoxide dehydrogenase large subunit
VASILGHRVERVEDLRMLTVGGMYVEDVPVKAAWVHFVRAQIAHGRIVSIDVDDARNAPGVLGVFTGDDITLPPFPHVQPILPPGCERPLVARGRRDRR